MNISIIDIGTQSIKHYIFTVESNNKELLHYKRYSEANLGESKDLNKEAIDRTVTILDECKDVNTRSGVVKTQVLGTEILRKASSTGTFLELIKQKFDFDVKVISHDDEARYLYEGFISIIPDDLTFAAVNIGGGSTEIVIGDKKVLQAFVKIPFGVKSLRSQFYSEGYMDWDKADEYIEKHIHINEKASTLFVTGVIVTSLTAVGKALLFEFDSESIPHHTASMSFDTYWSFVDALQKIPVEELKKYYTHDPIYADNVALCHSVYRMVAKKLGAEKIILSQNDLTDGVLYELLND